MASPAGNGGEGGATLIMRFPLGSVLPNTSRLRQIFSQFGAIDPNGVIVSSTTSTCRVVFLHKPDALSAYRCARRRNSLFGNVIVRYDLVDCRPQVPPPLDLTSLRNRVVPEFPPPPGFRSSGNVVTGELPFPDNRDQIRQLPQVQDDGFMDSFNMIGDNDFDTDLLQQVLLDGVGDESEVRGNGGVVGGSAVSATSPSPPSARPERGSGGGEEEVKEDYPSFKRDGICTYFDMEFDHDLFIDPMSSMQFLPPPPDFISNPSFGEHDGPFVSK